MTKYGYARVSTKKQNLSEQINELQQQGIDPSNIISEKYTGTKIDRPEWKRLMGMLRDGDTLVVTKIDRLARNMREALNELEKLRNKGVVIDVLNMGKFDNTPNGRLMQSMLLAFAEFERDMIVERTRAGREYKKEHDPKYKEGRPKQKMNTRRWGIFNTSMKHSVKETAELMGVCPKTVSNIKRQVRKQYPEQYEQAMRQRELSIKDVK